MDPQKKKVFAVWGPLSLSLNYKVRGRQLDLGFPILPVLLLPGTDLLLVNCFLY